MASASVVIGDHADVMQHVVEPVLAALYGEGEVSELSLREENGRLVLIITTLDGPDTYDLASIQSGRVDAQELIYHLGNQIEEYISESSFAWGQQRGLPRLPE